MSRRRALLGAALGAGSLGGLGGLGVGVVVLETRLARRRIGEPTEDPPVAEGRYGDRTGEPLVMAMLGDSSAAGLGVHRAEETPAVLLASGLAEVADQPVRLVSAARVGARSADLAGQLDAVLPERPDVAVVMVGANDVTHRVRPAVAVGHLAAAVRRLRDAGAEVVVGTCPDLGTIEPVPQPLRWVARRWSRRMAAAQTVAVVRAGGRSVSLGDLLGPEFAASPREMFGPDRFHPSAAGYAAVAATLLPSVGGALGVWPEPAVPATEPTQVLPLGEAALAAAERPGTEVTGTADRAGRLGALRRRLPGPLLRRVR